MVIGHRKTLVCYGTGFSVSAFLCRCLAIHRRREVDIMLRMIRKCIQKFCPRPVSSTRGREIDAAHVVRKAVRRYGRKTADADGVIGKSEWRGILFQDKAPISQQYFVYCARKSNAVLGQKTRQAPPVIMPSASIEERQAPRPAQPW